MKIILASSNQGKIEEIQKWLQLDTVIAYSDILGSFEIEETGISFQENALIKAQEVVARLEEQNYKEEYIVIADDSGLSVPALDNEPGIYSARYAGKNTTDQQNNDKLIQKLQEQNIQKTAAFYTSALAIGYKGAFYTTHGWMHGEVITEKYGENGFGYDPLFIPNGYTQTLGVLNEDVKIGLSHRSKALALAMELIGVLLKR